MTREDAISEIKAQSPDAFLEKAKKRGYICPVCGNGTGKDGTGIVKPPSRDGYKCFKCGRYFDIFDLIGLKFNLQSFNDQLEKASNIYGITIANNSNEYHPERAIKKIESISEKTVTEDLSAYYKKCHAEIDKTNYLTNRGISKETIDFFNIGYDSSFSSMGHSMRAIIFPTSCGTYEARNIDIAPGEKNFRYIKHGNAHLFNIDVLTTEKEKPVIIVEGIIDALSIMEAGGQAIGLSSACNYRKVLERLDHVIPAKPLILCLDTDKTGQDNEAAFADELEKRKIPFLRVGEQIIGSYHDPNERLMQDKQGLIDAIGMAYDEALSMPDPEQLAREEYLKTSAGKSISAFRDAIAENAKKPHLSTGFKKIDEALDGGLYSGLYFIGAISSLGKTTLTIQIADNLAKQGRDVLFFSLEQSRFDIMSKSISRETFLYCMENGIEDKNAKSNLSVLDGRRWDKFSATESKVMENAFNRYEVFAEHMFIHEGVGNISVAEIREKIKNHICLTGNTRPIVFIDYLQILKASEGDERGTDKQVVDHNVTALKQLSRDFDIPILAVSSLNRDNYNSRINMAAFKESGAIEYGSDVLIGLQFSGAGDKDFDVEMAKGKIPREIEFWILKNRNGRVTANGIPLKFYPMFNCFLGEEGLLGDHGFYPIISEMEDHLPFH